MIVEGSNLCRSFPPMCNNKTPNRLDGRWKCGWPVLVPLRGVCYALLPHPPRRHQRPCRCFGVLCCLMLPIIMVDFRVGGPTYKVRFERMRGKFGGKERFEVRAEHERKHAVVLVYLECLQT